MDEYDRLNRPILSRVVPKNGEIPCLFERMNMSLGTGNSSFVKEAKVHISVNETTSHIMKTKPHTIESYNRHSREVSIPSSVENVLLF